MKKVLLSKQTKETPAVILNKAEYTKRLIEVLSDIDKLQELKLSQGGNFIH